MGDVDEDVASNRQLYARTLEARPVFLDQVHGSDAVILDSRSEDGVRADACVTNERGLACTILVADCLPILFANARAGAVGAAHAGWRGLSGVDGVGVVESAWHALQRLVGETDAGSAARDTLVWLGPCIGPERFEVGPEVRERFISEDARAECCFVPAREKWLADLAALARIRLARLGLTQIYGNDSTRPWCTVTNPELFFSHRRDRTSGRFGASIWLA